MSIHAYFQELEAVVQVLEEYVQEFEPEDLDGGDLHSSPPITDEQFAAIWQAAELLARAYQVLIPLVQLDLAKQALVLPDVQVKPSGLIVPDTMLPGLEDL